MAADEKLATVGRRRRKTMLKFHWAGIEFLLQTRGQSAIASELLLETGRQLIFLGESRW